MGCIKSVANRGIFVVFLKFRINRQILRIWFVQTSQSRLLSIGFRNGNGNGRTGVGAFKNQLSAAERFESFAYILDAYALTVFLLFCHSVSARAVVRYAYQRHKRSVRGFNDDTSALFARAYPVAHRVSTSNALPPPNCSSARYSFV